MSALQTSRAEVRLPWQDGLQMQTDEVGLGKGDNQRKSKAKVPMAESSRKGSEKEKGCTPMVMGSHPMAKERAEKGAPAVAGRAPAVAGSRGLTGREINLWSTRGGGE